MSTVTIDTYNKKRKWEDAADAGTMVAELKKALLETEERAERAEERVKQYQERAEKAEALVESMKAQGQGGDDDEGFSDDESEELDANQPWNARYLELREYRIINGDCNVPLKGANPKLGKWVSNQKIFYNQVKTGKGKKITQARIDLLEALDISWGKKYPAPAAWEERFEELAKYQKAMGSCNVNMSPGNPSPLAKWVSAQRSEYRRFKKGKDSLLTLEQIGQLKEIGFNWKGPRLA